MKSPGKKIEVVDVVTHIKQTLLEFFNEAAPVLSKFRLDDELYRILERYKQKKSDSLEKDSQNCSVSNLCKLSEDVSVEESCLLVTERARESSKVFPECKQILEPFENYYYRENQKDVDRFYKNHSSGKKIDELNMNNRYIQNLELAGQENTFKNEHEDEEFDNLEFLGKKEMKRKTTPDVFVNKAKGKFLSTTCESNKISSEKGTHQTVSQKPRLADKIEVSAFNCNYKTEPTQQVACEKDGLKMKFDKISKMLEEHNSSYDNNASSVNNFTTNYSIVEKFPTGNSDKSNVNKQLFQKNIEIDNDKQLQFKLAENLGGVGNIFINNNTNEHQQKTDRSEQLSSLFTKINKVNKYK